MLLWQKQVIFRGLNLSYRNNRASFSGKEEEEEEKEEE